MDEIGRRLEEYGLTKNETSVYLACLRLGGATVYLISEYTKLPKSTCYDTLNSLKGKGLMSSIKKEKKIFFEASEPRTLIRVLEEKKRRIEPVLSELEKIKGSVERRPEVRLYHGKEGIKSILESVLQEKKELLIVGNFGKFKEHLDFYSDIFIDRRIEKKIKCKLIEEKSKENFELSKRDKSELRKTKFLRGLADVNAECYVYGNNVAILTLLKEEPFGI
ncbi:MAG: hypothetical protein KC506_02280, partial [Nanoarchaeota archaeon]|nr:hypothetical protein [Nanoarchaeota archaeon]